METVQQMYLPPRVTLPQSPSDASNLLRSTIPAVANPVTFQLSYGRNAVPNLIRDLGSDQLHLQQRALVSLAELLHSPNNISQAIDGNIIEKLIMLLSSQNITCRQKSSECIRIVSTCAVGRNAIYKDSLVLTELSKTFNDSDDLVRKNVHQAFSNLSSQSKGVLQILDSQLFGLFISKVENERLDIQECILLTCYNCIRLGNSVHMPAVPLRVNALHVFTRVASTSSITEVQTAACECIMMLCFYAEAKRLATNSDTITTLLSLLGNSKWQVRGAACGAVMSISIDVEAKKLLVRENVVKALTKLLDEKEELVQLNSLKAITNCAEDYRGRFQLAQSIEKVSCIDKLKNLARTSTNKNICEAANKAVEVITWRP